MRKVILIICTVLMLVGCSGRSYEDVAKKWVEYTFYGEKEKVFTELACEQFKEWNFATEELYQKAIDYQTTSGDEEYAKYQADGITYKYKSIEVVFEYTKEKLEQFNKYYDKNYSDLKHIKVYYEEYQNEQLVQEHNRILILVKEKGSWYFLKYGY